MKWEVLYHPEVDDDLTSVGQGAARRIVKAIDKKLTTEPLKFDEPLSDNLGIFRKLRIGDYRVVYQVIQKKVIVYVLAVGPRRDKEVYQEAVSRLK
jgi:mRNA interferase RelE/StbE